VVLTLSITRAPAGIPAGSARQVFDELGGSVGRSPDNQWVLSDPERFLSSCHCRVHFEQGIFYIIDTSTNGTFINGKAEPIGKGARVNVVSGDTLELGDYQLEVTLDNNAEAAPDNSLPLQAPALTADDPFAAHLDGFGSSVASEPQNDFITSLEPVGSGFGGEALGGAAFNSELSLSSDAASVDPLELLGVGLGVGDNSAMTGQAADPFMAVPPVASDGFATGGFDSDSLDSDGFDSEQQAPSLAASADDDFLADLLAPSPGTVKDPIPAASTQADAADPMAQSVNWPSSQVESAIPADWDDDLLGGGSEALGARTATANTGSGLFESAAPMALEPEGAAFGETPATPVPAKSTPAAPLTPQPALEPDFDKPGLERGDLSAANTANNTGAGVNSGANAQLLNSQSFDKRPLDNHSIDQRPVNSQRDNPSSIKQPLNTQANARGEAAAEPQNSPPLAQHLGNELLKGLGLVEQNMTAEDIRDLHESVGELMPVVIEGMMRVLRGRASVKNEFRMNVTTIQPIENNPLKFSANPQEAIDNMFLRKSGAYMGAQQAFREGFEGISEHQVAIIAGIRAGFKTMMQRFDPDILKQQFDKHGKGIGLPGMSKGRYWNCFNDYYKGFSDDMENSFQHLFGEEFVQAYEDHLHRLAAERQQKQRLSQK